MDKTRIIVWGLAILFILLFAFFGPSSIVQSRNMKKVRSFSETLTNYEEFENIKIRGTTGNLGRLIAIDGTLKRQKDLAKLEDMVKEYFPPEFHVVYSIEIEDDSFAGNWTGSGVDSEGNEFTFAAKVTALGDDNYRVLILDKLDTTNEPMHIMDGILKDGQYEYTADEGLCTGGGTLDGDEFEGYYKGPIDGTFTMERVK